MADVLEIPARYRNRMSHQLAEMEQYRKFYNWRWFLVCELFFMHRKGK